MDIDENRVRDIVREELANFAPQKKKRGPNKWQVFLKDCAKEQDKELPYTERVKVCSAKYKEGKNKIPDSPPPEQSTQPAQPPLPVQPVQLPQSAVPTQSEQFVQPMPPAQSAQPTYHNQQMLTEDEVERLIRLSNEKLVKALKRQ